MHVSDEGFLREYAAFSCQSSLYVGKALHARVREAYGSKDYEAIAHCMAKLHAEMVLLYETTGALLRALSMWEQPGGIVGAMLNYRPGDVPKFLKQLQAADDLIAALCFPEKEEVKRLFPDKWNETFEAGYSSDDLRRKIGVFWDDYLTDCVRSSYNKLKHGIMVVRSPVYLVPGANPAQSSTCVYILLGFKEGGRPNYLPIPVTGQKGQQTADTYLNNIEVMTDLLALLARTAANLLSAGLMQRSTS